MISTSCSPASRAARASASGGSAYGQATSAASKPELPAARKRAGRPGSSGNSQDTLAEKRSGAMAGWGRGAESAGPEGGSARGAGGGASGARGGALPRPTDRGRAGAASQGRELCGQFLVRKAMCCKNRGQCRKVKYFKIGEREAQGEERGPSEGSAARRQAERRWGAQWPFEVAVARSQPASKAIKMKE